ncbi:MAG: IS1595 family transposase [Proteobacteria bacterium]|nr:IS1595 family transposase [Pseudomonadota bacterium]MBU4384281.1 IS1595 family transposase [Pseudomonadota bacterium]MCG2764100.1 IS1595 family transposase [Desulfarculaceae bacterium]
MNIIQVYKQFPTEDDCIDHLERVRWGDKPICPYCNSDNSTPQVNHGRRRRYHCNNCNTAFSVTVGTIFHHTHLDFQKWFLAISLILNAKKGISARQLSRDLEVNKDTAWRVSMKIREAMSQAHQRELLTGLVEMDETYIGGKPRKGGPGGPAKRGRGTDKTPVVGIVERGGKIKAKASKKGDLNAKKLSALVRRHVDIENAVLMTDEYGGYMRIKTFMAHEVINHKVWYVDGNIHTNTIESFWALLKRGIVGQYHKVSVKHLPMYLDEFCYRYNYRKHPDLFGMTISRGLGVRV